jgi:hypothetical protein
MENDVIQLGDFKKTKKLKQYISDITKIISILSMSQKALSFFKQYVVAQEIISIMETNKTFLEIHLKRYEKELAEITGKHTEQSENR